MTRSSRVLSAIVATAALVTACGGGESAVDRAEAREIVALDAGIPLTLNGLDIVEEDITETLSQVDRPYLDAASLYSFRDEDLLQATLQIGRFSDDVDLDDEDFLLQLVTLVGSGAREFRIGEQSVFVTGADRQTLTVWFKSGHMFILSTRDTFDGGRSLLRSIVQEVSP